ncbi:MAG: ATP-binding protein [Desulfobacterales bacterium]|nr:ATP-binding protein [Desulfobacterales bacterium]
MTVKKMPFKIGLIAALTLAISVLHYGALHGHLGLHILHRELYFIPILLAAFWFGLLPGLATAVAVSLIYAPHVFAYSDPHGNLLTVVSQILVFNLVAVVLGWLVDRQKRQQTEALAVENLAVLGRAAAAVGHEMQDLLGALKRLADQARAFQSPKLNRDFEKEMGRLEAMVAVLSSFEPQEQGPMFSRDLNEIIREQIEASRTMADRRGVRLLETLDPDRCPSRVSTDKLGWVLGHLLQNALEVSETGQTIQVRSRRGSTSCHIEVRDEGPGIRPEQLAKIFTPFFTTKKKGYGLALAGSRKILQELGGDIEVESEWGKGSVFRLKIPRDESVSPAPDQGPPVSG